MGLFDLIADHYLLGPMNGVLAEETGLCYSIARWEVQHRFSPHQGKLIEIGSTTPSGTDEKMKRGRTQIAADEEEVEWDRKMVKLNGYVEEQ